MHLCRYVSEGKGRGGFNKARPQLSLKGVYYQILDLKESPELHLVNSFVFGKRFRLRTGKHHCPNGEPVRHSVLRVEYGLLLRHRHSKPFHAEYLLSILLHQFDL
jgi:hypothetical protein